MQVREVLWGDINLKECIKIPKSHSLHESEFDEYIASVENHQCPKIVRVYRVQAGQEDRIMHVRSVTCLPSSYLFWIFAEILWRRRPEAVSEVL